MSGTRSAFGSWHPARTVLSVCCPAVALLLAAGCAGSEPAAPKPATAPTVDGGAPPAAHALSEHENGAVSAGAVVQALRQRGLLVPNPMDITAQMCPANRCDQSIVTDTVRVTSFPSSEAARHYADEHRLHCSHNVVAAFPPVLSIAQQDKYWSAIAGLFP